VLEVQSNLTGKLMDVSRKKERTLSPSLSSLFLNRFSLRLSFSDPLLSLQNVRLIAPHRKYVREAAATKWDRVKKQEKPIHLFLFNDMMIWTKPATLSPASKKERREESEITSG
jgi:hypothetical protein